jgi:hypothetical protein
MESQLFLWPSQSAMDEFMSDPRRTAPAAIVIEPSPEPKSFPGQLIWRCSGGESRNTL